MFVVPQFEPIFEKLAAVGELPILTQMLVGTSHLFIDNWIAVFSMVGYLAVLPFATPADFDSLKPAFTGKRDEWAIFRSVLLLVAFAMPFVLFVQGQFILALACV